MLRWFKGLRLIGILHFILLTLRRIQVLMIPFQNKSALIVLLSHEQSIFH